MTDKIDICYYDASGKKHDAGMMIDQADLFRFACAMVPSGVIGTWWDHYPVESLPNGGRSPDSPEEAEQFMRHTRSEAIRAGIWVAL